ncbi:MAG: hypothetical protein KDE20_05650 [Caldilineaceae bacterium]|nr:hypothetical protein [Caldilineaceae bacterium]
MKNPWSWRTQPERYRLATTRCPACGDAAFPPRPICPTCGATVPHSPADADVPPRQSPLVLELTHAHAGVNGTNGQNGSAQALVEQVSTSA